MCTKYHFQWEQSFFGLKSNGNNPDSMSHHKRILELCYYSNGSISISEAYNLPIPYRYFYIKLLNEIKTEENDNHKNQTTNPQTSNSETIAKSFNERNNKNFDYLKQLQGKK